MSVPVNRIAGKVRQDDSHEHADGQAVISRMHSTESNEPIHGGCSTDVMTAVACRAAAAAEPASRRPLNHPLIEAALRRAERIRGTSGDVVRIRIDHRDGGAERIEITAEVREAINRMRVEIESRKNPDKVPLSTPERKCLEALYSSPHSMTGDEVSAAAGYANGNNAYRVLPGLIEKKCVEKKGGYRITGFGKKVIES